MPSPTDVDDAADIAVQPALPSLGLPEFEGIIPVAVLTRLKGTGQRVHRAIHHGEKVILLVEAELADVQHPKTKEGVKRVQILAATDLYLLEGKASKRILSGAKEAYRLADDARHGRKAFPIGAAAPVLGPEGWTDENGTVLSDEDVAERRGEIVERYASDRGLDPVVVVLSDGTRALWPDDWQGTGVGRPKAGDVVPHPNDGDEESRVVRVDDADTGEVLEEWTDADEDARLAALEEEARRREAAEDAEAFAAVTSARLSDIPVRENECAVMDGEPQGVCSGCAQRLGEPHLKACLFLREQIDPPEADASPGSADDEPFEEFPVPACGRPACTLAQPHEHERPDDPSDVDAGTGAPDGELELDDDDDDGGSEPSPEASTDAALKPLPPWETYDRDTIPTIKATLERLEDRTAVLAVASYEETHKNRKGVLEAVGKRAGELFAATAPRADLATDPDGFPVPEGVPETEDEADDIAAAMFDAGDPE